MLRNLRDLELHRATIGYLAHLKLFLQTTVRPLGTPEVSLTFGGIVLAAWNFSSKTGK